jgi:hypothetical protein
VSLLDTNISPMLKAIEVVNRTMLGFTPIPTNVDVRLELVDREHWKQGYPPPSYDAMLHLYAQTHRTIGFRKTADGYQWISEQELHYGPKMFTDQDGTFQEYLAVEYQIEPVNGVPTNRICVTYRGQDKRLEGRDNLTLAEVMPFLEEWKGTPIR